MTCGFLELASQFLYISILIKGRSISWIHFLSRDMNPLATQAQIHTSFSLRHPLWQLKSPSCSFPDIPVKNFNFYSGLVAKPPYFMTLPLQPWTSAPVLGLFLKGRLLKSCQSETMISWSSQDVCFCKEKAPHCSVTSYFGMGFM